MEIPTPGSGWRKVFPLFEVNGSPGHDRACSEAAVSRVWPTQLSVGKNDKIVKRSSNRSSWSGGPVEMQVVVNSPESESRLPEFKCRLFQELCDPGQLLYPSMPLYMEMREKYFLHRAVI